ncbi:unnamed protein product [Danaus chrysippus]|uniref:(African queen) hypothetical protein n=1 Tax=Danaus chrysippus TaxID=151541 RepID=A0A8J2QCX9_9NEOP|nr:unnamed protein product [Danaus chrysippus]
MEKPVRYKQKNKKPASKPKSAKKRKSDGPTCSMFLAELTRRLAHKKKAEEESKTIIQTIVDSITNALPVVFTRKTPPRKESPTKIETLQSYAPELLPNDIIDIPRPVISSSNLPLTNETQVLASGFKIPKMPFVSSEVFKPQASKKAKPVTEDMAVNTGGETDVASEIAKHVGTLRKISLIAEEFNQKTAKNLKEIVDSVQEDLMKKLEEIQAEQRALSTERQLSIDGRHETTQ